MITKAEQDLQFRIDNGYWPFEELNEFEHTKPRNIIDEDKLQDMFQIVIGIAILSIVLVTIPFGIAYSVTQIGAFRLISLCGVAPLVVAMLALVSIVVFAIGYAVRDAIHHFSQPS